MTPQFLEQGAHFKNFEGLSQPLKGQSYQVLGYILVFAKLN
jgi:hypothetical protein